MLHAVLSSGRTSQRSMYHVCRTRASVLGRTCSSMCSTPFRESNNSVFSEHNTARRKQNGDLKARTRKCIHTIMTRRRTLSWRRVKVERLTLRKSAVRPLLFPPPPRRGQPCSHCTSVTTSLEVRGSYFRSPPVQGASDANSTLKGSIFASTFAGSIHSDRYTYLGNLVCVPIPTQLVTAASALCARFWLGKEQRLDLLHSNAYVESELICHIFVITVIISPTNAQVTCCPHVFEFSPKSPSLPVLTIPVIVLAKNFRHLAEHCRCAMWGEAVCFEWHAFHKVPLELSFGEHVKARRCRHLCVVEKVGIRRHEHCVVQSCWPDLRNAHNTTHTHNTINQPCRRVHSSSNSSSQCTQASNSRYNPP